MKPQQAKIAALTLNITSLEYHQIEGQINKLMEEQEKSMVKRKMSEFSLGARTLVGEIAAKHHKFGNIRPIKKLGEYVFRKNKEVSGIILPELDSPDP